MLYPIGLLIATLSIVASSIYLKQPMTSYFDFVAFFMVVGGTVAVGVIVLPWEHWQDVIKGLRLLFFPKSRQTRRVLRSSLDLVREARVEGAAFRSEVGGLPGKILNDGMELIMLGLSSDKIEAILRERVYQAGNRSRRVANSFRSIAKYPPAFGLAGTVLGLVNLMRGISSGLGAKETGFEMSVALIATLYGLLLANLVINPAGELVLKESQEEQEEAEIALRAVLLASEKTGLLESQELLNSYVSERDRLELLGHFSEFEDRTMKGPAEAA